MPSCQQLLAFTSILYVVNASLQLSFTRERRSSPPSLQRRHRLRRDSVEAPLQNAQTDTLYLVNVTIGSPSQNMMLQLDTGSRDIWVPWSDSDICSGRSNPCTNGAFNPSDSTTFDDVAPDLFHVAYVDGTEIVGDYFRDTFGIGGISVENQTMGIAKDAIINDLSVPFQGIVGVGPGAGEAVDGQADTYPNLISMLRSQGHTDSQAYSLWLNDLESSTGSILFGAIDNAKFDGDIVALPIQPDEYTNTTSSFTVVLDNLNIESRSGEVQYSKSNQAMPIILDSGTTLTYLPDDIANEIMIGVGAGADPDAGVYVPCNLRDSRATFNFGFGNSKGPKIQVEISEFVIPYATSDGSNPTLYDGTEICQWGINGAGQAPNLFGDTFLRSAYVVYDLENEVIGIAQTVFNVSDTEVRDISSSIPNVSSTATGSVVTQTFSGEPRITFGGEPSATGDIGGSAVTATFDLFGPSQPDSSQSDSSRPDSAASDLVQTPSTLLVTVMAVGITLGSGLSGALMILL